MIEFKITSIIIASHHPRYENPCKGTISKCKKRINLKKTCIFVQYFNSPGIYSATFALFFLKKVTI